MLGVLLIVDFSSHVLSLVGILMNKYFGGEYGTGYAICLAPYLAAIVLISIFICSRDSPKSRSFVPWAFLLAGISSLLIAFWVVIYISNIYPEKVVKIPKKSNDYGAEDYDDDYDDS